jgi:hypothetical protein
MQEGVLRDNLKPGIKGLYYFHQRQRTTDFVTTAKVSSIMVRFSGQSCCSSKAYHLNLSTFLVHIFSMTITMQGVK